MTIWMGRAPAIVLSGYETIRTALVKRAEDFSSRKIPPVAAMAGRDKGNLTSPIVPSLRALRSIFENFVTMWMLSS